MNNRFPQRTGDGTHLVRATFADARWRAAQRGFVLTRERRLLGAIYALTPLEGVTEIFYDLGEVRAYLDRAEECRTSAP